MNKDYVNVGKHRALIRFILTNALKFEWSIQGLGMLRLYLSPSQRLHVWSREAKRTDVSTIHDHPWDFDSLIISGSIENLIFENVPQGLPHLRQQILCGPGGGVCGAPEEVGLICRTRTTYGSGWSYFQKAEVIHESEPSEGAVTLITRTFRPDTEHANVFYEAGKTWVSAEPRVATAAEIERITRSALDRWQA